MSQVSSTASISVEHVSKFFRDVLAVDDISFSVGKGEVVGFLGPNGAGKTTTMRIITGFYAPTEGEVLIDGESIADAEIEVKRKIGYIPENNPLYADMTVEEYLSLICDLRGIRGTSKKDSLDYAVDRTGLSGVYYKLIGELSKGYCQRVGLAQAIVHGPEILLLDEPTEGLDPNQRVEIRNLIKSIGESKTVVLSTHVLQEVSATCNRAVIISDGKIIADGTLDAITSQTQTQRTVRVEIIGKGVLKGLKDLKGVAQVKKEYQRGLHASATVIPSGNDDVRPVIFNLAMEKGWTLIEMHQEEASFEEVFRKLTTG